MKAVNMRSKLYMLHMKVKQACHEIKNQNYVIEQFSHDTSRFQSKYQ